MAAATEPISPELVLVCPELRAALHAAWRSATPETGPGDEPVLAGVPASAESVLPRVSQGGLPLLAAATLYAIARATVMLLQVGFVLVLVALATLAATGFLPL
jgi:hypothetical protein